MSEKPNGDAIVTALLEHGRMWVEAQRANGSASRETFHLVKDLIRELNRRAEPAPESSSGDGYRTTIAEMFEMSGGVMSNAEIADIGLLATGSKPDHSSMAAEAWESVRARLRAAGKGEGDG